MVTSLPVLPESLTGTQTSGLRLDNLSVDFPSLPTLREVSLTARAGRLLAIVGESGAGKSLTLSAMLGLLPRNARVTGRLRVGDLTVDLADQRSVGSRLAGTQVALVPQSPSSWLTPVRTLGSQLSEAAVATRGRRQATEAVAAAVAAARFPSGLLSRYPHEVSGGQLQRAALALALVGGAHVLLADEPTTGLDPDLAASAVAQLRAQADAGRTVVMVTHDLSLVERTADDVVILYGGRVVEACSAPEFFARPAHPYSAALLNALPTRGFTPIPGWPPPPGMTGRGCAFAPRCPELSPGCHVVPALRSVGSSLVACHHPVTVAAPGLRAVSDPVAMAAKVL